ncbi:ABC transporter permease [Clostridium polyendosporum]|uniref:ABC transporter permease n=1 Tax=Clostridium polyendosporum TaxID=69208 RepID=A0A919VGP9_9CLOT|nr:sugar ABC transporter permease [Clostridium polyendosporum]GIM28861.1 ABC transporter permease [Clostridium polyendosporum]
MELFYKKWSKILAIPAVLLFTMVILIPFVIGVIYSFTGWRGTYFAGGENWWQALVGFDNYVKVFKSENFTTAFLYTLKFTGIAVISVNIASLIISMMLTNISRGAGLLRAIFYMPNLLSGLALGFIWQFIFQIVYSKIFFGENGIFPIEALTNMTQSSTKAMFALVIMVTWQMAGYMMMIYVNGLNNIPKDLYEAANIDGANFFQKFKNITLPMLMPSFTVVFFLTISGCFRLLDQNIALTNGNFGTRMLALQILQTTKDTNPPNYGLAQAQAVIFFILIAAVSLVQVSMMKKKEVEA